LGDLPEENVKGKNAKLIMWSRWGTLTRTPKRGRDVLRGKTNNNTFSNYKTKTSGEGETGNAVGEDGSVKKRWKDTKNVVL